MQIKLSLLYNVNIIIVSYYVNTIKIILKRLSVELSAQQEISIVNMVCTIYRSRYTFYFFCTRLTVYLYIRSDTNNKWITENPQIVLCILYDCGSRASRPLRYAGLDFRLSRSLSIMLIVVTIFGLFLTRAIYYCNLTTTLRTSSTFLCH